MQQNKRAAQVMQTPNTLSDIFPETATDACATAFITSQIKDRIKPILWVQDHISQKEAGFPYLPGIRRPFIMVKANRPADLLWAIEDGLKCAGLAGVVGEIWGDPPALNFTATKRLAMRAEAGGISCWLIRRAAAPNLSAARERWRIKSLPSKPHPNDPHAPGDPRWQVELFRSRRSKPSIWVLHHDRATDRIDLSAPIRDGTMAQGDGTNQYGTA